jgi:hypothetical protein
MTDRVVEGDGRSGQRLGPGQDDAPVDHLDLGVAHPHAPDIGAGQ